MYLGIDLGTSGLRALLINDEGVPVGSAERHYKVAHLHAGWSEQDPKDWIDALENAVAELRALHSNFGNIRGIGVAGQMHGATLLDAKGSVLRPCILWNDTRSSQQAAHLDAIDEVRALTGNIVFPGFTAPKLEWVRAHEPEIFDKIDKVLLPAAYLNYYLTGEFVSDMSDGAGTSWMVVGERAWSEKLLQTAHMRKEQMPRLVDGSDVAGTLRGDLARKWGLALSVVVAGGAGDNAAAACGIGALNEGQGFVSLGTSGVLLAARDGYYPAPETALHTFCHALPGRWYQMGVMLSATGSLNWMASIAGEKPEALTAALGTEIQRPGQVRFLPYLSGERTPHNDAEIRGSFTGLSASTSREDLTRAVLEGVAFALRDNYQALVSKGAHFDCLVAIGGGTGSRYWTEVIATVLGIPLALPGSSEFGAALGAARLGMVAATGADPETVMIKPDIRETIDPVSALAAPFEDAYQRFEAAFSGVKSAQ